VLGPVFRKPWRALLIAALLAAIALGAVVAGFNFWASYHFRSAQACLSKYHDAEGLDHLRACLYVWPEDPESLLMAARAARRLGAFVEAKEFQDRYERARGEDDNLTLEWVLLRAEQGELDAVRDVCRLWVSDNHASTPLILEAQARGYLRQFRLQDAANCLKQWLERQPDNPQALFLQGKVEHERLNPAGAIASFGRLLQVDPEHHEARALLADYLLDIAQPREALPHVQYLQRHRPTPRSRLLLAKCYGALTELAKAEAILDELLADQPHYGEALAERGRIAFMRGHMGAAESWLRKAVEEDPAINPHVHYQLFQVLTRNGKNAEAQQVHKRWEQILDDLKHIQEIITVKMQAAPHDPALHYEIGLIALRAGNAREGLRWLNSAVREDPTYAPAHIALAVYHQETGSPGRAAEHRAKAQAAQRNTAKGLGSKPLGGTTQP
jgi:tetratricopeptide (TPR) repeat protein